VTKPRNADSRLYIVAGEGRIEPMIKRTKVLPVNMLENSFKII
jgi:hypothetical protein